MCHSYMLVKCAFVCFVNVVLSGFDMMCACAVYVVYGCICCFVCLFILVGFDMCIFCLFDMFYVFYNLLYVFFGLIYVCFIYIYICMCVHVWSVFYMFSYMYLIYV